MTAIALNYEARNWQQIFHHRVLCKKFSVLISSRQIGKTELAVAELVYRALEKKADYGFVAPYSIQCRKIFWSRLKKILTPLSQLVEYRETDLICTLPNGSRIFAITAENEGCRGLTLAGLVVDEFDSVRTDVWTNAILPTLASHPDHFIIFIGTLSSSGKLIKLFIDRKDDPDWYCHMVNAVQSGVFSDEQLARFKLEMGDAAFAREFMCDPSPPVENSVLGIQISQVSEDGRIKDFPINPMSEIYTSWDLGFRDHTSIWCFQLVGNYINLIGYHEYAGISLTEICHRLKEIYRHFGTAVLPHDGANTDFTMGVTRKDTIEEMLGCYAEVLPKINPAEGLNFTRLNIPRCVFHKDKCIKGIQRLKDARYVIDQKTQTIADRVVHDDNSHCLDSFRYLCTYVEREYPSNDAYIGNAFQRRSFKPKVIKSL